MRPVPAFLFPALFVAGCGGGGTSSPATAVKTPILVEGKVTAPVDFAANGRALLHEVVEGGFHPTGLWREGVGDVPLESSPFGVLQRAISPNGRFAAGLRFADGGSRAAVWRDGRLELLPSVDGFVASVAVEVRDDGMVFGLTESGRVVKWSDSGNALLPEYPFMVHTTRQGSRLDARGRPVIYFADRMVRWDEDRWTKIPLRDGEQVYRLSPMAVWATVMGPAGVRIFRLSDGFSWTPLSDQETAFSPPDDFGRLITGTWGRPVRLHPNGTTERLAAFPGPPGRRIWLQAVSSDGSVIVHSDNTEGYETTTILRR